MASRAINIVCARAMMSRHNVLVMFFCMRLEKHVCNAMSHDLLLGLAVVSFAHLIIATHSSVFFSLIFMVRFEELSYLVRRLFLSNSRRHCLCCDSARIEG